MIHHGKRLIIDNRLAAAVENGKENDETENTIWPGNLL
jgi:hypothetical protein